MRDHLDKRIEDQKRRIPSHGSTRRKGIGVLGLHEGRTLLVALNRTNLAFAAAGCDLDEKKIASAKTDLPDIFYTTDYAEMLKSPHVDIVAIYTPDAMHGEHVIQAFRSGKDVICTKPLINSMEDARKIVAAQKETGKKLLVGQSTRFFEPFRRQRSDFEKGSFGTIEFLDAHYIHRMDWYYEKSPWVATDTDWIFLGLSHPIDLLRWYLGRIEEVHAYSARTELGKRYGVKGYDLYTVNMKSTRGGIGRALGHYGLHELPGARNSIELFLTGTKRTSLAQYHDMRYRYSADDGTEMLEDPLYQLRHYYFNNEIHGMHYGEFANYAEYFADALINNKSYSPDLYEGVETFCVMEAVRRSALEGKPISISPLLHEAGIAL